MCGIYGWIGKDKIDLKNICSLVDQTMHHRGPDDGGLLIHDDFGFGFRRLSILDLSPAGHQPMSTLDGNAHIAFNGEIYNYLQLKPNVSETPLRGHADSEVLLNLLYKFGETAIPMLNGMFAFSFVNSTTNTFIIARDRLGVKPLYYSFSGNSIVFASELEPLVELAFTNRANIEINPVSVHRYLHFGHISAPDTIYKGVYKLQPGHMITGSLTDPTKCTIKPYWSLPTQIDESKSESQWLEEIDALLMDATSIRLISDVPVGLFLSGGIDSTLVAHYASAQAKYQKPKALTVTFDEKEYSELSIAEEVARAKGLELIPIKVGSASLDALPKMLKHVGEPYADSSLVNQYILSEQARKHATVFLTGDGGDEAFAGYHEYVHANSFDRYSSFAVPLLSNGLFQCLSKSIASSRWGQLLAKFSPGVDNYGALLRCNFRDPLLLNLLSPDYQVSVAQMEELAWDHWGTSKGLPIVHRMQRFDYTQYLEPDVLVKVDRATMAHSIEARSPFLDYRVVELGLQIPTRYNIGPNGGKELLRKLAYKHLPKSVFNAPKKGFGLPIKHWINSEFKLRLLKQIKADKTSIWNVSQVESLLSTSTSRDLSSIIYRIWMVEIWKNRFV